MPKIYFFVKSSRIQGGEHAIRRLRFAWPKQKVDVIFHTKSVKINPHRDLPFISAELKKLDRQIKREYRKHNKSIKYQNLKKKYDDKFKCASSKSTLKS